MIHLAQDFQKYQYRCQLNQAFVAAYVLREQYSIILQYQKRKFPYNLHVTVDFQNHDFGRHRRSEIQRFIFFYFHCFKTDYFQTNYRNMLK